MPLGLSPLFCSSMQVPLFIARRIAFNKAPSFSRFIIRLAMGATALSVAAMVVTLGLVEGFQHTVSGKVYSFWGHVRVQALAPLRSMVAEEEPMERSPEMDQLIAQTADVQHWHAFAAKSVVVKSKSDFEGLLLKGVSRSFSQSGFERFMVAGRSLQFADDSLYSQDLLLSQPAASQLQVQVGDTVQMIFIRQGENIRSRNLVVCGLYKTGIDEYDRQFALADLAFLQRINQWSNNEIGGYEIWMQQPRQADTAAATLSALLPQGVVAEPIKKLYPNIFDWLSIQNQTKLIVICVMIAVAVINLITCLLILVMERARMVGVLQSLGMSQAGIQQIFWYYAAYIAGCGIAIGLALSLGLLGLQQATGFITMDEATYYVRQMPVRIIGWQVLAVAAGSFVVCLLALRLPLYFVNRIQPVKVLRFS